MDQGFLYYLAIAAGYHYAQIYIDLSNVLEYADEYSSAIEVYKSGLEKSPEAPMLLLHYLGNAYLSNKEYAEAARTFQKAVKLNHQDTTLSERLVKGGLDKAIKVYKNDIARRPTAALIEGLNNQK